MPEQVLCGAPASPGVALGAAWLRPEDQIVEGRFVPAPERDHELETAKDALAAAAAALSVLAERLAPDEAEIVQAGVLMAGDPALAAAVEEAILVEGVCAAEAVLRGADAHAAAIAAIGDETLAARADDVRSLGRRAARLAMPAAAEAAVPQAVILIAQDLGPADVAELASSLVGVALVGGGATAHAAIVARSLGLPMVTGLEPAALDISSGTMVALDGARGTVTVDPAPERARRAGVAMRARRASAERSLIERDLPAVSTDGRRVSVLGNVASTAELEIALGAGAEGIGLLRTELAFLDTHQWPSEPDHRAALEPILAALGGRPATVRVLDFGADKSPPFLRGCRQRGLQLLLDHVDALTTQLRAILAVAEGRDVRILLPLVDRPQQLVAVRELVHDTARMLRIAPVPGLGAMIETPAAAQAAPALAAAADFLSIGTNDLTATTLGADRFRGGDAYAYDPLVLRAIARSITAAHEAGISIEVCGEAASDPLMLPLLLGLGVDEVSVGAARVGSVRRWIRRLSAARARDLARSALQRSSASEVAAAAAPWARELESVEGGHPAGERVEGNGRVLSLGT